MYVKARNIFFTFVSFFLFSISPAYGATSPFCGNSGGGGSPSINTAIGCIPADFNAFIGWILPKLFGIAGGISFVLIIYGFILLITSNGDAKKVQGANETITSAIVGLLVSIFSLFILRFVLVDLLHIPGIQ
jgi:hypothetical protein